MNERKGMVNGPFNLSSRHRLNRTTDNDIREAALKESHIYHTCAAL